MMHHSTHNKAPISSSIKLDESCWLRTSFFFVLCCWAQNDAALIDFLVSDGPIVAIVGGVVSDIAYV